MTLQELFKTVNRLSPEERAQLRAYLDQQEVDRAQLKTGTMNVDILLQAAQAIRADMNAGEFDQMIAAMNEEYIELVDDNGWLG